MATRAGLLSEFAARLDMLEERLVTAGIRMVMTEGFRSITRQNALYALGRTKPGKKVTNARGGYSWHNFGLAADYAFLVDGKPSWNGQWTGFGAIVRGCGLEWGGDFKSICDRPHVQLTNGRTLAQMRAGG